MTNLVIGTLIAVSAVQTDTTFAVGNATRLSVESEGGSISVATWDRPEVRVQADHSSRTFVDISRRGTLIDVEPDSRVGPTTIVDFIITVPRGMNLELEGGQTDISIEGSEGEISAESTHGDLRIVGGRGVVRAESVNGEIHVEGAEGRIELEGVSRGIRVRDSAGDLVAETVAGDVVIESSRLASAEVGTVGGRIFYDGSIRSGGQYFFGTHGGSIRVRIPNGSGAHVSVATIYGSVSSNIPGSPDRFRRGDRTRFTIGDGSAEVEVETYSGRIALTSDAMEPRSPGSSERWPAH